MGDGGAFVRLAGCVMVDAAAPSETGSVRAIVGRGSAFALVPAAQAISVFLVLSVLTTLVTPAELGEIAAAQLVMQLAALVAAGGVPGLVTREFFDEEGPRRARRLIGLTAIVAPVSILCLHLAGPWWSSVFESLSFVAALQIALWAAWPRSLVVACAAVLRAERRVSSFVALSIASQVGSQIVGLAALAVWGGPTAFMAGIAVGQTTAALVGLVITRPRLTSWLPDMALVATLATSWPIALNSAAGLIVTTGDRVLIERMLGLEEVGRYQIAYLVGSVGIVLLVALNNAWAPAVYARSGAAQNRMLVSTTHSLVLLAATISVALAAVSPIALRWLAPAEYRLMELTGVVALVASAAVPFVFYLAANHDALVERSTLRLASATMVAAIANVAGNVALIPLLGLEGAAAATVASYVVWAAVMLRGSSNLEPGAIIQPLVAPLAGSALLIAILAWVLPSSGGWLIVRGAIGLVFGLGGLDLVRRSLSEGQRSVRSAV